jgi:hypothetical protein
MNFASGHAQKEASKHNIELCTTCSAQRLCPAYDAKGSHDTLRAYDAKGSNDTLRAYDAKGSNDTLRAYDAKGSNDTLRAYDAKGSNDTLRACCCMSKERRARCR